LKRRGIPIANEDNFADKDLKLANCKTNPLTNGTTDGYRLIRILMSQLTLPSCAWKNGLVSSDGM